MAILNELGVSNSSVLMSNCSIWVEGSTDRITYQAYLDAYIREMIKENYMEDLHYSYFEYAGSNVEHYLFGNDSKIDDLGNKKINARFLSNRIMLIADMDKGKEIRHEGLKAQQDMSFVFKRLNHSELENLISRETLIDFLKIILKLKADEINVVEKRIVEEDYRKLKLGKYLAKLFKGKESEKLLRGKIDSSGSLTPYYKNKMAEFTRDRISWHAMTDGAKEVAIDIYEFIREHNKELS